MNHRKGQLWKIAAVGLNCLASLELPSYPLQHWGIIHLISNDLAVITSAALQHLHYPALYDPVGSGILVIMGKPM